MPIADSFKAKDGKNIRVWRWPYQAGRPTLHWAHATGFHARLYQPLLNELSQHVNIFAWDMRGHGESDSSEPLKTFSSWNTYYRDLCSLLDLQDESVWLAGHSVGATVSMAAATLRPDKVKGCLLIEPVIFDRKVGWSFGLAKRLGQGHKMNMASNAARRREKFPSRQHAFDNFRSKSNFSSWSDEWLSLYVEHGFHDVASSGDVTLACQPEWESRSFAVSEHRPQKYMRRYRNEMPMHIAIGEKGSTFFRKARPTLQRLIPQATLTQVKNSTHFLPMEEPEKIQQWIKKAIA